MLTRRNAILAPALMAVTACQRPTLGVTIEGPVDSFRIAAYDSGWFGFFASRVPIAGVTIETVDNAREVQWQIGLAQTTCDENLRRVQYGALPEGFTEFVAPRRLVEGVRYEVLAAGCDGNHGFALFVIANGRVRLDRS